MARALPDLPLEIWLEIFQFATYVHRSETIQPLNPFTPRRTSTNVMGANTPSLAMRTKLSLVLVCRAWRRLAVKILYRHIVIRSPARADAILHVLENSRRPLHAKQNETHLRIPSSPGYGEWARHIEVYTYMRGSSNISFLQTVFRIFRCCPNLQYLSGRWTHQLPIEFLQGISALYGQSLQGIYWGDALPVPDLDNVSTPEFLGTFTTLRILDLTHYGGNLPAPRAPDSPRPILPCVQELILSNTPRSLRTATILDLPKLRNLTLRTDGYEPGASGYITAFLNVHGHSLLFVDLPPPSDSELDFDSAPVRRNAEYITPDLFLAKDICSNLESFIYCYASPIYPTCPHPNLRRVGIRGITSEFLYPDKPSCIKNHLTIFTPEKYPCLELVQMIGFLVDAHADSIMKDACIWWVERFEKMGILFLDGECVLWMYADSDDAHVEEVVIKKQEERQSQTQTTAKKIKDRCTAGH